MADKNTDQAELDSVNENEELFVHHRLVADNNQELLRVDKFCMNFIKNLSRNKLQNGAKAGCLRVNDKPVKSNYRVRPNDVITIVLPRPVEEHTVLPEEMPLDIRYEDDDLIILMKPAGLVVHPGVGNFTGTLVNGLKHYFEHLPDKSNQGDRPGLVHRLDKDTTGLMVIAKNEVAMTHLANQFFERTVHRRYVALVWGDFDEEEGTIDEFIGRNPKYRQKQAVFPDKDSGKHAVTHYKVLERFGYVSMIECRLETGRTHQIRVHLSHEKHPLFNDAKYGGDRIVKGTVYTKYKQFVENCFKLIPRHALHAKELGIIHPTTGEEMFFDSDLPQDMELAIDKWRKYRKK